MKNQAIVYIQNNGIPAVVFPTSECLQTRSIQEIAVKDVPAGKKFKIVDVDDLPFDMPQESWEIAEEHLTDGIGGESSEFN